MQKFGSCSVLSGICVALSLCAPLFAFAGESLRLPSPLIAPMGSGTVEVITGATITRPPLPPPDPAPSGHPESTGDLIGAPAIFPGVRAAPVAPLPPIRYALTLGTPVAGRDNLSLVKASEVREALIHGAQLILLDVRDEQVRRNVGHITGDGHIPFIPTATFPACVRQAIPDTRYPVVVYCSDGGLSSQAADIMSRLGYRVYLMGAYPLPL